MQHYIGRRIRTSFEEALLHFPVVALVGPRQCGKSTFARNLLARRDDKPVYLDLEDPSDLAKLGDGVTFFRHNQDKLVCLDEVQRRPELFRDLRPVVDSNDRPGQFIVLGSASPELLRQSSESLAGRVAYIELGPFKLDELPMTTEGVRRLWLRGGFPRSLLAPDDAVSSWWRREFVRTFLERDVPQWGFRIPADTVGRLWRMLAHEHGQVLNVSRLAQSLGVSPPTVRSYVDLLAATYMIRLLPPLVPNLGKRVVKSPRVFIRDTGILHSLSGLDDFNELLGHPCLGSSWEGLVIEHAIAALPNWAPHVYRTSRGAELDLVLEKGRRRLVVEARASAAPTVTRGFWSALDDVEPEAAFVVAPVDEAYPLRGNVPVVPLAAMMQTLAGYHGGSVR